MFQYRPAFSNEFPFSITLTPCDYTQLLIDTV